jgi:hypothetical protein
VNIKIEDLYSYKDHLKVGLSNRTTQYLFVGAPDSKPLSPFEEAVKAAMLIHRRAKDEPVKLCISGGIDSECMALAFKASGVEFTAEIFEFEDGYNQHDVKTAFSICRDLDIKYNIHKLDIVDFFESRSFIKYTTSGACGSPQIAAHCWLADQVKGVPVFAGNFIFFHNNDINFDLKANRIKIPDYKEFSVDRFLRSKNRFGVSSFLLYTPNLVFSFFEHTRAQNSEMYDNSALIYKYDLKKQIYSEGGFNFGHYPERTTKFTGFEVLKDYFDKKYNIPGAFDILFRHPLHEFYPEVKQHVLMIEANEYTRKTAVLLKEIDDARLSAKPA